MRDIATASDVVVEYGIVEDGSVARETSSWDL
jgi:hypothetical protein